MTSAEARIMALHDAFKGRDPQVIARAHDGSVRSKIRARHVFQLKDALLSRLDAERGGDGAELASPPGRLLPRLNDAAERRDIKAVMSAFHPSAAIPDHLKHRTTTGHAEIRAFYLRPFETIRVTTSLPLLQRLTEDRREAISQVQVRGVDGGFWWENPVRVDYRIQDGQIFEMNVAEHLGQGD